MFANLATLCCHLWCPLASVYMQSAGHWQASVGFGSRRGSDGANHYHRSSITLWHHHLLGAFRGAAPCHWRPWSRKCPDADTSAEHLTWLAWGSSGSEKGHEELRNHMRKTEEIVNIFSLDFGTFFDLIKLRKYKKNQERTL